MPELKWRLASKEEVLAYEASLCRAKRGPRSTVTCEKPKHPEPWHIGRSRTGKWFCFSEQSIKGRDSDGQDPTQESCGDESDLVGSDSEDREREADGSGDKQ
jgi:hypothetical protein